MFVYCLEKSALFSALVEFPHQVEDNEIESGFYYWRHISNPFANFFLFILQPFLALAFSSFLQSNSLVYCAAKASSYSDLGLEYFPVSLYDRDLVFRLFCFVIFSFSLPTRFAGQQNITYRYFARRLSEAQVLFSI